MYILPVNLLKKNERIILYGAGSVGKDFYEQLYYSGYCYVSWWIDINGENKDVFNPQYSPEIWNNEDRVLIAIKDKMAAEGVMSFLFEKFGVGNDRVLWCDYTDALSLPMGVQTAVVENYYAVEGNKESKGMTIEVRFVGTLAEQIFDFLRTFSDYRISASERSKVVVKGIYWWYHRQVYPLTTHDEKCIEIGFWPGESIDALGIVDYQLTGTIICDQRNCYMTGARGDFDILKNRELNTDIDLFDRKFCNFIYSNSTRGEGAKFRQEFCLKLSEYRKVDCPGKVLNNMSNSCVGNRYGDWEENKLRFIRDYKFTIAFENERKKGYIKEKLIHPLCVGSVPIYYGAEDVDEYINKDCFINTKDFDDDWDAVVDRVKEIDNDRERYMYMLSVNPLVNINYIDERIIETRKFFFRMFTREGII